jgi:hypothetical protein
MPLLAMPLLRWLPLQILLLKFLWGWLQVKCLDCLLVLRLQLCLQHRHNRVQLLLLLRRLMLPSAF